MKKLFWNSLYLLIFCFSPLLSGAQVKTDKLIYKDNFEPLIGKKNNKTTSRTASSQPVSVDVTTLQSYPGSQHVVFLDFDGEYFSNPIWHPTSINVPSSSMSDADILEAWELVNEDFRPFDLNITTDINIYNAAADGKKARCMITTSDEAVPGQAGQAFGSFKENYKPSFIVSSADANAMIPHRIGNTISHEVGHLMGLRHDGIYAHDDIPANGYYIGHNNWSPIMGSGFDKYIIQFDAGEYAHANNDQRDIDIISSANGFSYRPDDHGNSLAAPSPLKIAADGSVNIIENNGVIEKSTDLDVFFFATSGGSVDLNFNTAARHANLDILVKLYNESNQLIVVSDPPSPQLGASLHLTLPEGRYYIFVDGTGYSSPLTDGYSDYGSLGYYSISGSVSGSVISCNLPAWSTATAYVAGNQVTFNGQKYTAKWWTQNEIPSQNTGDGKPWQPSGTCGLPVSPRVRIVTPSNQQIFSIHPFKPVPITVGVETNHKETAIDYVTYKITDYNEDGSITTRILSSSSAPFGLSFSHIYSLKTEITATSYSGSVASVSDMITIFVKKQVVTPEIKITQPLANQVFIIDPANPAPVDVKASIIKYDRTIEKVVFTVMDLTGRTPVYRDFTDYTEPYEISFIPTTATQSITAVIYYDGEMYVTGTYDQIGVRFIACPKPQPATVTTNTDGSVTFSWPNKLSGEIYKLQYREKGSINFDEVLVYDNSITLERSYTTPQQPGKLRYSYAHYEYKAANQCSDVFSEYTDLTDFNTGDCGPNAEPKIGFLPANTQIACLGQTIHFFYAGSGSKNALLWRIDDGPILSDASDFYYTFNTAGTYFVRLTEYSVRGCPETRQVTIVVSGTGQCCTNTAGMAQFSHPADRNIPCKESWKAHVWFTYAGGNYNNNKTWYVNGVAKSTDQVSFNYIFTQPGNNMVTLVEKSGNCTVEKSVTYYLNQFYTRPITLTGAACAGNTVRLSVEPVNSGTTTYWTLPAGMTQVSNWWPSNTIDVELALNFTGGAVSARSESGECRGTVETKTISTCTPGTRVSSEAIIIQVYPNPFNTSFSVSVPDDEKVWLEISDVQGNVLYADHVADKQLLGETLNPGVYIVKLTTGTSQTVSKIMKQ